MVVIEGMIPGIKVLAKIAHSFENQIRIFAQPAKISYTIAGSRDAVRVCLVAAIEGQKVNVLARQAWRERE
jgi:hypothetical protein